MIHASGALLKTLLFFSLIAFSLPAASAGELVAGHTAQEALSLGERMYREGVLPSGELMEAVTHGDIPVNGRMFTCANCHLRSGLGTIEGSIITPPTNAAELFTILHAGPKMSDTFRERLPNDFRGRDRRPSYTDETLARAILEGVDASGRVMDPAMPKYFLQEDDARIMVHYLKNLSSEISPGVTDDTIRFATVITEDVTEDDRTAMLAPLEAYVRDRNSQNRHQEKRSRISPFYRQEMYTSYRRIILDIWELKGPRESWKEQLETYYGKNPVFALLGGISAGSWAPIHQFSEEHRIPCIFPVTEFPVVADGHWYTLYFSKGHYQEGEAAARYIARQGHLRSGTPVVQVIADSPESQALARGFRVNWNKLTKSPATDVVLEGNQVPDTSFWKNLTSTYPGAVFVAWLPSTGIEGIAGAAEGKNRPALVVVSSSLAGTRHPPMPGAGDDLIVATYPYRLPTDERSFQKSVERWLETRKIPLTNMRIKSRMYFLGSLLSEVLRHMKADFYRDYFLDIIDMMRDQTYTIATYPRLSFGPGQRYASKGCYIVRLSADEGGDPVPLSNWVVY